jgi:hypothetical protein
MDGRASDRYAAISERASATTLRTGNKRCQEPFSRSGRERERKVMPGFLVPGTFYLPPPGDMHDVANLSGSISSAGPFAHRPAGTRTPPQPRVPQECRSFLTPFFISR